jgi:aldose 1-epimerase
VPLDECRLELPATTYLPMERERNLPTGTSQPVAGTEFDFRTARPLQGVWLDTPFSALVPDADGRVRTVLRAPDGTGTVLWTEPAFRWVQVFTADPSHDQAYPGRGRALAVEPMTCPPDAFNSRIDMMVLEPGEERSMRCGMSVL